MPPLKSIFKIPFCRPPVPALLPVLYGAALAPVQVYKVQALQTLHLPAFGQFPPDAHYILFFGCNHLLLRAYTFAITISIAGMTVFYFQKFYCIIFKQELNWLIAVWLSFCSHLFVVSTILINSAFRLSRLQAPIIVQW